MTRQTPVPKEHFERIVAVMPEASSASMTYEARAGCWSDAVYIGEDFVALFALKPERFSPRLTVDFCDLIRDRITLPLPSALFRADGMIICPRLPGGPLHRHILNAQTDDVRALVAEQLGQFLEEFQGIPTETVAHFNLPKGPPSLSRADLETFLDSFCKHVVPHLMRPAIHWIQEHLDTFQERDEEFSVIPCLHHGELAPPHIFFSAASGRVSGIIDFDSTCLADPAQDLFWLIWAYGQRFVDLVVAKRPALKRHYFRARFLAGFTLLRWMLSGVLKEAPSWYGRFLTFPFDFQPLRRDERS